MLNNVEFYKCTELTNVNSVSNNGFIIDVNGGVYIGNNTNNPILIANKVEKVSELINDENYTTSEEVEELISNAITLVLNTEI